LLAPNLLITAFNIPAHCMNRHILFFLLPCQLFIGCKPGGVKQRYQYAGEVVFRRSYVAHENLPDAEVDSLEKSNPFFMFPTHTAEDTMLIILAKLGVADKNYLLLDKIAPELKDTIFLSLTDNPVDTICINYKINKEAGTASIQIKNGPAIDSIPIKDEAFSHSFSLLRLNDPAKKMFAVINQYYIMNGDNYEVSIYEKK